MSIKKVAGILFLLCLLTQLNAFSQDRDSLPLKPVPLGPERQSTPPKDSARLAIEAMPRKAAIRSALLPGLGQIHNRRWWKVPLVYGAFVGMGLVYEFNQRYYKMFLKEAQFREANPTKTDNPMFANWTTEGIIMLKDDYRRNRDLSIGGLLGVHALQIIDAYIDAKFFRFDISDDLAFKVSPTINQGPFALQPAAGIKLKLSFQ